MNSCSVQTLIMRPLKSICIITSLCSVFYIFFPLQLKFILNLSSNLMFGLQLEKPSVTCPPHPTSLKGILSVDLKKSPLEWTQLEAKYGNMEPGGQFSPDCKTRHKVAILIPCRDRDEHLRKLLDHLLPILQRQLITFGIYVIEQVMIKRAKNKLKKTK